MVGRDTILRDRALIAARLDMVSLMPTRYLEIIFPERAAARHESIWAVCWRRCGSRVMRWYDRACPQYCAFVLLRQCSLALPRLHLELELQRLYDLIMVRGVRWLARRCIRHACGGPNDGCLPLMTRMAFVPAGMRVLARGTQHASAEFRLQVTP